LLSNEKIKNDIQAKKESITSNELIINSHPEINNTPNKEILKLEPK